MAILAVFTGKGFTKQMYDALRPEVQWETNLAPGAILHVCGFDEAGDLHVIDVWESEARMNEFLGQRLLPKVQTLGIPLPDVSIYPVHNVNVYPDAHRFDLK